MKPMLALRNLLPLLAVMGLLLAPMARPVAALPSASTAATADEAAAAMPDMPCCPYEAPASDCAKVCPLLAICMSPCMESAPAIGLLIPCELAGRIAPGDDASPEHRGQAPPGKPPKA